MIIRTGVSMRFAAERSWYINFKHPGCGCAIASGIDVEVLALTMLHGLRIEDWNVYSDVKPIVNKRRRKEAVRDSLSCTAPTAIPKPSGHPGSVG
ncbi:hypothetical protein HPB52_019195 [Rhipicephalus sanguineus]|uniref:Uncharacterized protein n=1 Tax=Rhipicephalus sanguineus TaxID=34632 RepID=A0A9D4PKR8_RHISA|nr:hypothetical protein HPB52_019195 [Rhipicephalus sanguineus]